MRTNLKIVIALIVLLAPLPFVLSGCSIEYYRDHPHHGATYWTHGKSSDQYDQQAANKALARAIRDKLQQNPMLQDENIGVEADDGNITLRGHVHDTAALRRAVNIAESAPGVNGVESRIVVKIGSGG